MGFFLGASIQRTLPSLVRWPRELCPGPAVWKVVQNGRSDLDPGKITTSVHNNASATTPTISASCPATHANSIYIEALPNKSPSSATETGLGFRLWGLRIGFFQFSA